MQQDNHLTHSSRFTTERQKKKRIRVLQWLKVTAWCNNFLLQYFEWLAFIKRAASIVAAKGKGKNDFQALQMLLATLWFLHKQSFLLRNLTKKHMEIPQLVI